MIGFAPGVTTTCSGSTGTPRRADEFAAMASRSWGRPVAGPCPRCRLERRLGSDVDRTVGKSHPGMLAGASSRAGRAARGRIAAAVARYYTLDSAEALLAEI